MTELIISKDEIIAAGREAATTSQQQEFADIICTRVSESGLTPEGYLMLEALVVLDLGRDKDGFTGQPMRLGGLPPITYSIMARLIRGCLPEKFREAMETVEKEIQAEIEAGT